MRSPHRRLACLAVLLCLLHPPMQAGELQPVVPGVTWLPGRFVAGEQPDGNSVLFDAPDGVVLVDTGRHSRHADALLRELTARRKPLAVVVNSHWHLDHIGGNAPLRAAYPAAQLWASRAIDDARSGFLARYAASLTSQLDQLPPDDPQRPALQRELRIIGERAAQTPTHVVERTAEQRLAGQRFVVGLAGPAVTAADVWLYDPERKVLAAGDLVTLPAPLLDTACPERWRDALSDLAAQPFVWLVPGHGMPMQRTGFETYRSAYANLLRCAASDSAPTRCTDAWLQDAAALVPSADVPLARALLGYYFQQGPLRGTSPPATCAG
jgi:glyoxylase-like metal-dependent hydrolase (beta-lactamase superfamily II)